MSFSDTITTLTVTASGHWDRWDGDGRPDYWPIFPIAWFLIIVGIVVTVILVTRRNREHAPRRAGEARLAERYAAGEIDEEEYRARLGVLREK